MQTNPALHRTDLRVSDAERDRAVAVVQEAYADGRLNESELERRLELAFSARTRTELLLPMEGLRPTRPTDTQPAPLPSAFVHGRVPATTSAPEVQAGLTHLSGLMFSFFGPGAVYVFSRAGSPLHRQAAKALNFQVTIALAGLVAGLVGWIIGLPFLSGLISAVWAILTIYSSVKAFNGEDWTNPVTEIASFKVVREV